MAKSRLAAQLATTVSTALLILASGAVSAPAAAAEDPGWYVGLSAGGSLLSDSSSSTTTPATGPGAPGGFLGDIFGIPQIGPPICGLLGSLSPMLCTEPAPGTPGSTITSTNSFRAGPAFSASLGYARLGGLRPELALTYLSNDYESLTVSGSTTTAVSGKLGSASAFANLWYDFARPESKLKPYIGLGVGAAKITAKKMKLTGATAFADGSDTVLVLQAGLGVGYALSDSVTLSVDYRYLSAKDPTIPNPSAPSSPFKMKYKDNAAYLGLKFFLGGGAEQKSEAAPAASNDADGDGVPDDEDKCPDTPVGVTVGPDGCPLDADNDGTPDSQDKCPNTPKGVAVGPDGCPMDSDNDGVPDYLDKCAGTPAGAIVDANGCEADSDGDGVPDRLDKCPDTPPGQKVGPDGCPLDSDGDGVPDDQDECPHTPAGAKVLANGCALKDDCRTPRPGEEVDENGCALDKTFILRGVNFEFDSDRLTPEAKEILKQVAQTLQAYPDVKVEIAGHTDAIGTDAYNLGLSEKRAVAVKNFLTTETVDANRMSPNGYGESQPIDTNDTDDGRAKNRRVELRVIEEESNVGR